MIPSELYTPQLRLRQWHESDRETFARMNADPVVMEHYPACLNREQSDALVDRLSERIANQGWGLWAVELMTSTTFIGYCGLNPVPFNAPFTPAVEIGWRIDRPYWGQSYAFEAATAAMQFGFSTLNLPKIVSFTIPANVRSQRLMIRLDMVRDISGDFEHPMLPENHVMRPHLLYRRRRPE